MPYERTKTFICDEQQITRRLDNFLFSVWRSIPKRLIYSSIRKAKIKVNDKKVIPNYKLCLEDKITTPNFFIIPEPQILSTISIDITQYILYEDLNFIFINKPVGLSVHKGSKLDYGVIDLLQQYYQQDLFLIHRIDRHASGCLLIAKNYIAAKYCNNLLMKGEIKKEYHALVSPTWPNWDTKVVNHLIKNKEAYTHIKILHRYQNSTLLLINISTGRKHQIRIHLRDIGYPILGDTKYNDSSSTHKRMLLHASNISFPYKEKTMSIVAPYDREFLKYMR